jgi:organic radical activating enzyme
MDRGEFRSCCRTPNNKITKEDLEAQGIDAFLNSPKMLQSRLDLIQGIKTEDCKTCWNIEDSGMTSPRHTPESFWRHMTVRNQIPEQSYKEESFLNTLENITDINDPKLKSQHPYMLEISLGNTCDMKCMYCNHHYSTQWATEEIKLGRISQAQYDREFPKASNIFNEKFWEWFDTVGVKYCTRIGIIGGEPLIMPEFYTFVDKLLKSKETISPDKKVNFWVVTNMNTPKNYLDKFLTYLPKLSKVFDVEILVSMESVGEKAEYIRNGIHWDRFTNNVDKLLSNKELNFGFAFMPAINALSISSLKEFVMYAESLYHKHGRPIAIKQSVVTFPNHQSPFILTPNFAKYIDECVEYMDSKKDVMPLVSDPYGQWVSFMKFISTLADSIRTNLLDRTEQRRTFGIWFDDFDVRRNMKFTDTFPEYTDFYNMCKGLNG